MLNNNIDKAADIPPVINSAIFWSIKAKLFSKMFCKCCSPIKKNKASIKLKITADKMDKNNFDKLIYKLIIKFYS